MILGCLAAGQGLLWRELHSPFPGAPPMAAFVFFVVAIVGLLLSPVILRRREAAQPVEEVSPVPAPTTGQPEHWLRDRPLFSFLAAILLLGASLRFVGLNWDQGCHLHPDERFLTMVETSLRWPSGLGEYLDESRSGMNPRNVGHAFFAYGTLPTTLVKGVAILLDRPGYDQVYLVGRAMSALFDLGSIALLFLLARALYRDDRIALLAAFFLAVSVLPIQHAHFFVVDAFAGFFVAAALYGLARWQFRGGVWNSALAGLCFGLALACKISVFTFALLAVLAGAWRVGRVWEATRARRDTARCAGKTLAQLAAMGLIAFLAFRLAQPDAFRGPGLLGIAPSQRWLANLSEARRQVSGEVDMPPGHQWTNRPALWFPWENMVLWGMGLPLGLTAWAGFAAAGWGLTRRRDWRHLIPVAWTAVVFLHQATQWVKSMRYLLPIYPTLALLAAWLLILLVDRARGAELEDPNAPRRRWRLGLAAALAMALAAAVAAGTLLWALAFESIYIRPHTRIQASRWIYANIPQGSTLACEEWDDALPLGIDGKNPFGGLYRGLQMQWYAEDTPDKLQLALGWLDRADYVILSSNRLYDSIPRLPMRYPMTVRYYQALFDGSLGFERVAEFTSYPGLFGVKFPDQDAEEAFSVYDHPRVQIFKKTPQYSRGGAEPILGAVDWDQIQRLWPKHVAQAPDALMLPPGRWAKAREAGTWSELFHRHSWTNRLPVLAWALAIEFLGLLAAPYLFVAARGLPDRGYGVAKSFGLLLAGWLVWTPASLGWVSFSRGTIASAAVVIAAGALALLATRAAEARAFWRGRRRLLIVEEGLFWGLFLIFLLIRRANPDLWHPVMGGEKPMDFAYLNAVIKSPFFPPYDPWYAGGRINYYYFGFVLAALPIKFLGIIPQVAYNLAVPTLFALTATGAFAATLALVNPEGREPSRRELRFALLGALFVGVIGNLGELKLLLDGLGQLSGLSIQSSVPGWACFLKAVCGLFPWLFAGHSLPFRIEWWYWNPTRVISHPSTEAGPINEFPFFTFLYGDLHPHAMALPLVALALVLTLAVVRSGSPAGRFADWPLFGALALVLGALWPTNTWDYPTCAMLVLVALVLLEWRRRGSLTLGGLGYAVRAWAAMAALSYLLFLPFHHWYGAAYTSVEAWRGSRTPLDEYLIIHGFFLFVIVFALLADFWFSQDNGAVARCLRTALRHWRRPRRLWRLHRALTRPSVFLALGLLAVVAVAALGAGLVLYHRVLPGTLVWLLTLTAVLLFRRRPAPRWQMALVFVGLGLWLTLLVEFIVLKGDISRMNTVFKFYLQAWTLFALAAAAGAERVWRSLPRWPSLWRAAWRIGFPALLAATLVYPVLATRARIKDRFDGAVGPTLDGGAFMEKAVYQDHGQAMQLVWDKRAIEWMQDNVQGSPVIAEANTNPQLYGWGSRYAMFTGLPDIVGWDWHQRQQRAAVPTDAVPRRIEDVTRLYDTADLAEADRILRRYGVEYIVVGPLERACFTPEGIDKFERNCGVLWEAAYGNPQVHIYRVKHVETGKPLGAPERK